MSEDSEYLLDAACAALIRLRSGDVDAAERDRLLRWRHQSLAHAQAWRRAESLWLGVEALRGRNIPGSMPLPLEGEFNQVRRPRRVFPARRGLGALALTLACFALWLYPPLTWQADFITGKGERRDIVLSDGSRVVLNTDSALALHYDGKIRCVELLKGEAFFSVVKDSTRPFVVTAGEGSVTAVGTEFGVQSADDGTRVELVEGLVRVQDASREELLKPGQAVTYGGGDMQLLPVSRPDALSTWKDGYLIFEGTPLAEAVAQINRYRAGHVLVLDEALGKRRVSGLFRLDSLNDAIDTIAAALPAQQSRLTSYWVVLH